MFRYFVIFNVLWVASFFSPSVEAYGPCLPNLNSAGTLEDGEPQPNQSDIIDSSLDCDGGGPPTVPEILTIPSTDNDGTYTISWSASTVGTSNTIHYRLSESKNGGAYSQVAYIPGISHQVENRGDGSYSYKVEACIPLNCSLPKLGANSTTVRNKPANPGAPNPTTSTDTNSVTVTWTSITHATYYDIQWRKNNGSWLTAANNVTGTSKSLSGFLDGTWDFRIRACNTYSWSCSSYSSAGSDVIWRAKPSTPGKPTSPSTDTNGEYTVSWTKPSGTVSFYDLQERKDNSGSWTTVANDTTLTSKPLSGRGNGYHDYRVRACNGYSWACSNYSSLSTDIEVRLKPPVPSAPNPSISTDTNNVTVNWSSVTDGTYYDIQRRNNSGGWATAASNATGSSKSIGSFSDGSWDFRIRACNTRSWSCSSYSTAGTKVTWRAKPSTPAAPTLPASDTNGEYTISWLKPTGTVTVYDLQERHNNAGDWTTVANDTTLLSKTVSGRGDGLFDYRVRACNEFSWACSSYSAISADVDNLNKPGTPLSITYDSQDTTGEFLVSWESGSGSVDEYQLQEQKNSDDWRTIFTSTTAISRLVSGRLSSDYKYRVRACNDSGCSSYRTGINTLIVARKPIIPAAPTADDTSTGSAAINWNSTSHATYYDIQKRKDSGSWTTLKTDDTDTNETASGLTDGDWNFRVRACNTYSWSCSSYSAASSATTVRLKPSLPAAPTNNPATNTSGGYSINWSSVDNATVYDMQERKDNGSWSVIANDAVSFTITVSDNSTGDYDYRVRACNEFSWACSSYSGASADTLVRLVPTKPTMTAPAESGTGEFTLTWTESTEATYYHIQKRSSGSSWSTIANSYSGLTYPTVETVNGNYEYQVRACNEFSWSCSTYSDPKLVTVAMLPDFAAGDGGEIPNVPLIEPTVPANQSIGALEAQSGVAGGAASYQVPIVIPPGRAGMQPAVGLSYSSSNGSGLAGVGWSLSAGGAISRCAATYEQDGFRAAPQYDATRDRLCLNGQRLMLVSGSYGASGAVYRTELDTFARVTQSGAINDGLTSFTVESKSGRVTGYGATSDSRHKAAGKTEILTWAISDVQDVAGNTIIYQYTNFGDGEHLLTSINYTGKDGSSGDREVIVNYENRIDSNNVTDYRTSYLAGGKTRTTQRIENIQTFYGSTKIRQYNLTYGEMSLSSGRSLLRSVEECGYKSSAEYCLPSTNFEWQEAAPKYVFEPVSFDNNGSDIHPHSGPYISNVLPNADADGDGVRDWPGIDSNNDGVLEQNGFKANAEGDYKGSHNQALGGCYSNAILRGGIKCLSADFNQDGKTDAFRVDGNIYVQFAGSTTWKNTGISLPYGQDKIISLSDFNADGWPDLTVAKADSINGTPKVYIYFNSKNENTLYSASNRDHLLDVTVNDSTALYNYKEDIQEMGDLDGNGTSDFVVYINPLRTADKPGLPRPERMILTKSELNGDVSYSEVSFYDHFVERPADHLGEAYLFHDVNGDGLQDWLTVNEDGALSVKYNQGGSFGGAWTDTGAIIPMRAYQYDIDVSDTNFYVLPMLERTMSMDYDGDGKSELMFADDVVASTCSLVFHFPNNSGVRAEEYLCGDRLWSWARFSTLSNLKSPIQSTLKDTSARKYKAIYFNESITGDVTSETIETDIIAAAVERGVIDAMGNGLSDVVTTFDCKLEGCAFNMDITEGSNYVQDSSIESNKLYINRNIGASSSNNGYEAIDVLSKVTNGLGVESRWVYRPLGSEEYDETDMPFYDPDHEYLEGDIESGDQDYFHFSSSMMVVAEFKQSNGIGNGLNSSKYKYRGAVYHNKGRGFQGFRTVIVDNALGIRAVSDFHQKFPLAGRIELTRSCLINNASDPVCEQEPLSTSHSGYVSINPVAGNNDIQWILPAKSVSKNYELNEASRPRTPLSIKTSYAGLVDPGSDFKNLNVAASAYDSFGNILQSTAKVDSGFGVNETQTQAEFYSHNISNWWINKLKNTTVTNHSLDVSGLIDTVYKSWLDSTKVITTTINSYDENIRKPSKITSDPNSGKRSIVETVYNDYGLPTKVTTKNPDDTGSINRVVDTTYSSDNYFVEDVTNNLGTVSKYQDPIHGQVYLTKNMQLNEVSTEFDAFGRVEEIESEIGLKSYLRYAACANCDGVNNSNVVYKVTTYSPGAPETTEYRDKLNRTLVARTETLNGAFSYVHVQYDDLGRKTFESVPSAAPNSLIGTYYDGFDALGRLTHKLTNQTLSQNHEVEYFYGSSGSTAERYRTKIVVNDAQTLYRTYSGAGLLMQTTDALSTAGVTQYAYDGMGNPIVLQDANSEEITAKYNDLGQKLYVDDPNMGRKNFTYTGFGEVETETDANGNLTTYLYDKYGRSTSRQVAGPNENSTSTFEFDKPIGVNNKCMGQLSKETKGTEFVREYFYDSYCRVTSTITTIDGSKSYQVGTHYDYYHGRVKGMTYPNGLTVAYEYSDEGYLKRTYNAFSDYTYREITSVDEQGNWTNANVVNGTATITRNFYAATGQMKDTEWFNNSATQQKLSYLYDEYGNLEQQSVTTLSGQTSTEDYVYDDMHRLTSTTRSIPSLGNLTYNFDYDAVGNIKKKTDFSADNPNAYTYGSSTNRAGNGWAGPNAVRQVILGNNGGTRIYNYDENGNLVHDGIRGIQYNGFNKPIWISTTGGIINPKLDSAGGDSDGPVTNNAFFFYGSDQLRYKQIKQYGGDTITHVYIGKLFEEITKVVGGVTTIEEKSYVDDIAVITENVTADNYDITYFHRDRLGSMTAEINSLGSIVKAHSFDAFGRPRNDDFSDKLSGQILSSENTNRGFTDHEHLDDSQLIHMNGRIYDYNLGRFLSVDPFIGSVGNSQAMNPYSYILNNPMSGTDPSGYEVKADPGKNDGDADNPCTFGKVSLNNCTLMGYNGFAPDNGNDSKPNSDESNQPSEAQPDKTEDDETQKRLAQIQQSVAEAQSESSGGTEIGGAGSAGTLTFGLGGQVAGRLLVGAETGGWIGLAVSAGILALQNDSIPGGSGGVTGMNLAIAQFNDDKERAYVLAQEDGKNIRRPSSRTLKKTLTKAGQPKPARNYQAHHIVILIGFADEKRYEVTRAMRRLAKKFIDINSAENLVWLPVGSNRIPNDTRIAHGEAHRGELLEAVNRRLQIGAANGGQVGFKKALARVKADMIAGNRIKLGLIQ